MIALHGFETFDADTGSLRMDNFIIIDTDILIDAGRKIREAVDRLDKEEQASMLGTSVVVQMELIVGCRNKEEWNKLNRF